MASGVGTVPTRYIRDNCIMTFELYTYWGEKKGKCAEMVLKIDMEKAYDKMEWNFLTEMLKCYGWMDFSNGGAKMFTGFT